MNFYFHELIHFLICLLIGYFVGKKFDELRLGLVSALLGGFFIDLDHLIDYFLAFGLNFNFYYFLSGYQFLKTDKLIIPLHSFELVFILLTIGIFFYRIKKKAEISVIIFAFSISLFFHLLFDTYTNELPIKSYLLLYRYQNNFDLKLLVYPDHYKYHQNKKRFMKLD